MDPMLRLLAFDEVSFFQIRAAQRRLSETMTGDWELPVMDVLIETFVKLRRRSQVDWISQPVDLALLLLVGVTDPEVQRRIKPLLVPVVDEVDLNQPECLTAGEAMQLMRLVDHLVEEEYARPVRDEVMARQRRGNPYIGGRVWVP